MRVLAGRAEEEIREKGSVFLAVLLPVRDAEEVKAALANLASLYSDATHICWASRLGWPPRERSSDAGEPQGTAGIPILRVLAGADVTDVLAAVVRWFGGVKLGKGGLARAYAAAAREALAGAEIAERVPTATVTLEVPFERLGAVKRLIHPPQVVLESEEYGERAARLVLTVQEQRIAQLEEALAELGVEAL